LTGSIFTGVGGAGNAGSAGIGSFSACESASGS